MKEEIIIYKESLIQSIIADIFSFSILFITLAIFTHYHQTIFLLIINSNINNIYQLEFNYLLCIIILELFYFQLKFIDIFL